MVALSALEWRMYSSRNSSTWFLHEDSGPTVKVKDSEKLLDPDLMSTVCWTPYHVELEPRTITTLNSATTARLVRINRLTSFELPEPPIRKKYIHL